MAMNTRNERAGAQGLHIHPLHPAADGVISSKNRRMVAGVYPGVNEFNVVAAFRILVESTG